MEINRNNLITTLLDLGLSEKEAEFYLALLKTGPSTVLPIAKQAGIKRTSIYNFVEHLVAMGLVSFYVKNNRHYYQAENPSKIENFLAEKHQQLRSALPDLIKIYQTKNYHPQIKMFYGVEGMKQVVRGTLESQDKKVLALIDLKSAIDNLPVEFWDEYVGELINKKIIVHNLRHPEHKYKIPDYKYSKKENYQDTTLIVRYLPEKIKVPNTMYIYDNKVVVISPREENWALVVESQSFSQSMKIFHGVLWAMAKQ